MTRWNISADAAHGAWSLFANVFLYWPSCIASTSWCLQMHDLYSARCAIMGVQSISTQHCVLKRHFSNPWPEMMMWGNSAEFLCCFSFLHPEWPLKQKCLCAFYSAHAVPCDSLSSRMDSLAADMISLVHSLLSLSFIFIHRQTFQTVPNMCRLAFCLVHGRCNETAVRHLSSSLFQWSGLLVWCCALKPVSLWKYCGTSHDLETSV